MELRKYQIKAIEDIRHHFSRGKKRILLTAPCGSGKTVVASAMMQKANERGNKNLFVAHRRELVMQCSRKLGDFGLNHGVILSGKSPNMMSDVQVASVQSFIARRDRDSFILPKADLIILDEAHRSVSGQFQALIKIYPNSFIIGLTATPIRNDGRGLGNIYEELVECGTIKELTKLGYLVPNRIVAPTIPDLQKISVVAGDYDKKALTKKMNTAKLVGDIVEHWIRFSDTENGYRPTVVFATSIAHSKHIANIFNQNGVKAGHIDSKMSEIDRETQLANLNNGKIKVLCNCQILTEGWDCARVSCVIIARPTKSFPLYLQMVGRSFRIFPNKKDTVIIDHSGCVYEFGMPEDADGNWTLSTKKPKTRDRIKDPLPIEKQPFTCVQCDTVYQPTKDDPSCKNCGFISTKKERVVLISEGRLVEMPKTKPNADDKNNFFAQLLYYSRQKGFRDGWASHCFKQKYGHWPHSKQIFPIATGKDVIGFIQHLNIRRAKSRNIRELNL